MNSVESKPAISEWYHNTLIKRGGRKPLPIQGERANKLGSYLARPSFHPNRIIPAEERKDYRRKFCDGTEPGPRSDDDLVSGPVRMRRGEMRVWLA